MAASTLPWKLFQRHHLACEDEAYFYVQTSDAKEGGSRQDRRCDGGGTWKGEKRLPTKSCVVGGEKIQWSKNILSLRMGGGKSTGWVMHEYTIVMEPRYPSSLKICHISFTGHGQKRKRVPDDDDDDGHASQRARFNSAAEQNSPSAAHVSVDQEPMQVSCTTTTFQQDSGMTYDCADLLDPLLLLSEEDMAKILNDLSHGEAYLDSVPTTTEKQAEDAVEMPLPMVQESGSAEQLQSFCGDMPAGTQLDTVNWGGFLFC